MDYAVNRLGFILAAVNSAAGLCSAHAAGVIAYIVIVIEGGPLLWAAHV